MKEERDSRDVLILTRDRHTSRDRSPTPPRSTGDRLLALSRDENSKSKPARGNWLTQEVERYKRDNNVESDSEPTEEEITKQIKLPTKEQIESQSFKEPIKQWVEVKPQEDPKNEYGIPWLKWNKEILPEEEIVRGPDWKPPTPPRVDISVFSYLSAFTEETAPAAEVKVFKDKQSALESNEETLVIYHDNGIIKTTREDLLRQQEKKRREEEEDRRGGGGFGGRGGRGGRRDDRRDGRKGGGRYDRRDRDDDNPNHQRLGRDRARPRSQSSSPGRLRSRSPAHTPKNRREERRPERQYDNERDREQSRGGRSDRRDSYDGGRSYGREDRRPYGQGERGPYGHDDRRPQRQEERRPYEDRRQTPHQDRRQSGQENVINPATVPPGTPTSYKEWKRLRELQKSQHK